MGGLIGIVDGFRYVLPALPYPLHPSSRTHPIHNDAVYLSANQACKASMISCACFSLEILNFDFC